MAPEPRHKKVHEPDCGNLAKRIGQGSVVRDNAGQRKPADEEDQYELERSHLLARTPSHNPDHKDQKAISEHRSQHVAHNFFRKALQKTPAPSQDMGREREKTRSLVLSRGGKFKLEPAVSI